MDPLFLNYELSVMAKQAGFDEPCFGCWQLGKNIVGIYDPAQYNAMGWQTARNSEIGDGWVMAPLYQQMVAWFDERGIIVGGQLSHGDILVLLPW
jgi:hypothetical protein